MPISDYLSCVPNTAEACQPFGYPAYPLDTFPIHGYPASPLGIQPALWVSSHPWVPSQPLGYPAIFEVKCQPLGCPTSSLNTQPACWMPWLPDPWALYQPVGYPWLPDPWVLNQPIGYPGYQTHWYPTSPLDTLATRPMGTQPARWIPWLPDPCVNDMPPVGWTLLIENTKDYINEEKDLEYRAHWPGTFQFIIRSVEKPKNYLNFLYFWLHLCRIKPHNITRRTSLLYISCTNSEHSKQNKWVN